MAHRFLSGTRRPLLAALTAVTALATLAALLASAPSSDAARKPVRPAKAGIVWHTAQRVGPSSVSVSLAWAKVRRATSYEVDYAPTGHQVITGREVQGSRAKRTVRVRATRASTQKVTISGLRPNTTYCFQLRGRRGKVYGARGGLHCKATVETGRASAGPVPLAVGTWNVCSSACGRSLGAWSKRSSAATSRALRLTAAGRPVDVLTVHEGNDAVAEVRSDATRLDTTLSPTFTRGCRTGDGTGSDWDNNQAVYVRTATWEVVDQSAGGMQFRDNFSHGGCWVRIRDRATGTEVVVVSYHLWSTDTSAATKDDVIRADQASALLAAVSSAHPGVPVVLAGDSNSSRSHHPDGPLVRWARAGYDDAYDAALTYESPSFRNSAIGSTGAIRKSWTWGDHIDRVFAPAGVQVVSWKVDQVTRSTTRYATPLPSDHNPVTALLRLPAS